MAFVHGKDTAVEVDSNDLSAFTNSSEFNRTRDSHDTTTYGLEAHRYRGGLKNGTFTMSGIYDNTESTGPRAVLAALLDSEDPVTVLRQTEGVGSGLPQDSFPGLLTSYAESSPVADMVTWTAEFNISGPVDDTAQT